MTKEEASKQLKEQDLAVYGDGKFPIEDYIGSICKSGQLMFSDYVQVEKRFARLAYFPQRLPTIPRTTFSISMAKNDPIPSGCFNGNG